MLVEGGTIHHHSRQCTQHEGSFFHCGRGKESGWGYWNDAPERDDFEQSVQQTEEADLLDSLFEGKQSHLLDEEGCHQRGLRMGVLDGETGNAAAAAAADTP